VEKSSNEKEEIVRKRPRSACAGPKGIWISADWVCSDAEFYDFNVYRQGKVKEKLNYMHANPVIRGLVEHPKDWPWSSWAAYVGKEAMLSIDFVR